MKISTKGRYGLRILLELALHENDVAPRLIRDIAASQQISEKYISRLMIDLRRAGMVSSIRGAKGGFRLTGKPEDWTLLDIVEAMEGALSIVDCVRFPERCDRCAACPTRNIWDILNSDIREKMREITLARILENCRNGGGVADYCI